MTNNFNGKQNLRRPERPHFCTHDCEFVLHEMTVGDFDKTSEILSHDGALAQDHLSQNDQIEGNSP